MLESKIEKKKLDIEKRKSLTLKLEKKLETLKDQWEIKWQLDEIKTSKYKLKDLEIQLENLYKQQEKIKTKNEVERIPVIEEFLEAWKIKAIEWYTKNYANYLEYIKEYNNKREQLQQWEKENNIHFMSKQAKEKQVELGIDKETHTRIIQMRFNQLTLKLYEYRRDNEWEKVLEKEIEKEKNDKRQLFINRVKAITGIIKDASNLTIGDNGEINGIVTGKDGKAKVETISAGGWNIQCWHFRVLVRVLK